MRTLALLLTLLLVPAAARAQETSIPVATPVESTEAADQDSQPEPNVNTRYVIERVELTGIPERRLSRELRNAIDALVGEPLGKAGEVRRRIQAELPDYDVDRRISRGNEPGQLRVVFHVTRAEGRRSIHFAPSRSKLVFHEDQKWSGLFDIRTGGNRNGQISLGLVRGNSDDLIEEYTGYWLRAETREAGTKRLGLSLEFARFSSDWDPATLSALALDAGGPQAYGRRVTVSPAVTFALSPRVRVSAGASVSELNPLSDPAVSERNNAVFASVGYDQSWKLLSGARQKVEAVYEARSATTALDSDLVYRRHFGRADYQYERGHSTVIAHLQFGRITGVAPLFERFSLGDTSTLRGWDKYDIAPAGADRMFHQSIEYRYRQFAYFIDAGSVWTGDQERRIRLSTGVGVHSKHSFVTVAFPLNADVVSAKFMVGVRF